MQQIWPRHPVAIVGVGTTRQGAHPDRSAYQLGVDALKAAMVDAGIDDKRRIDGLFTSRMLSGIDPVQFAQYAGMNPSVSGDLDYSSAGFITQYAAAMIACGTCELVACVYGRNPGDSVGTFSGVATYDLDCGLVNANAVFAMGWARHMAKHGSTEEALGHVAIAARKHAALNPIAAWPEQLTMEQYLADDFVIWPFRGHDICRITAGAVALILARRDIAADLAKPPVYLHSVGRQQATRVYENDEHLLCFAMRDVASQVYGNAGMGAADMDLLCVSDACTAAVLHTLENFGFCGEGESGDFVKDGAIEIGGRLPVNPNGGQLGEGYLVGWLHHAELVRQLRGEAGARQVAGAQVGQYCATGGQRLHYLSSIYVRE